MRTPTPLVFDVPPKETLLESITLQRSCAGVVPIKIKSDA
jgi:hypothetical protein